MYEKWYDYVTVPRDGGNPIGDPIGAIIEQRPDKPRFFEDIRTPDLIFQVDNPDANYSLYMSEFGLLKYPVGSKLTYICWKQLKSSDGNCWKIELNIQFDQINVGTGKIETKIYTLYPWGLNSYNFNPDHVRNYYFNLRY